MSDVTAADFLELVAGRRGHFRMESGYHSDLWLDLDPLFVVACRVAPFVESLASALRPYDVGAVCGPLFGGAFLAQWVARELGAEFWHAARVPSTEAGVFSARYMLPAALARRASGVRVAMVDDVMSAGSSLRATCAELQLHGADPVVAGALLVFGTVGERHFAGRGIPVVAAVRSEFNSWPPEQCPHCAAGVALEDVGGGRAEQTADSRQLTAKVNGRVDGSS